jgi:hypothetical protein
MEARSEELTAFEGSLGPAGAAEAIDHHGLPVHDWQVAQLTRLEVTLSLAQADADCVDWHRAPSWCTAAARHGSGFRSSGEADPIVGDRRVRQVTGDAVWARVIGQAR